MNCPKCGTLMIVHLTCEDHWASPTSHHCPNNDCELCGVLRIDIPTPKEKS